MKTIEKYASEVSVAVSGLSPSEAIIAFMLLEQYDRLQPLEIKFVIALARETESTHSFVKSLANSNDMYRESAWNVARYDLSRLPAFAELMKGVHL